jgi:hypothetical protein
MKRIVTAEITECNDCPFLKPFPDQENRAFYECEKIGKRVGCHTPQVIFQHTVDGWFRDLCPLEKVEE